MAGLIFPRRGEIYWVRLDPTVGTEIAKTRPAVIISSDNGNEHADRVIVAPITSGDLERVYPFERLADPLKRLPEYFSARPRRAWLGTAILLAGAASRRHPAGDGWPV